MELRSAATFDGMRPLPKLYRSVVRAGLLSRFTTSSVFSRFTTSSIISRFRYELYIEGKAHLVACTYLVSFSLFSFSGKVRTKRLLVIHSYQKFNLQKYSFSKMDN